MSEGRVAKIKDSSQLIKLLQEYEKEYGTKEIYFIKSKTETSLDWEIVEFHNELRLHYNKDDKQVMFLAMREIEDKTNE